MSITKPSRRTLTRRAVAELLQLTPDSVRDLVDVPPIYLDGKPRYDRRRLERWVNRNTERRKRWRPTLGLPERFLRLEEAAESLDISRQSLRLMRRAGQISSLVISSRAVRIDPRELDALVKRRNRS